MCKKIFLGFIVFVLMLCFVGCETTEVYLSDTSSNNDKGTSIPIVIVDDENEYDQPTQSEIDEITENWGNDKPNVSIEIGTSNKDDNSNTSSDNEKEPSSGNSSNVTTSKNEDNNDETSSEDNSNKENSSNQESDADNPSDNNFNSSSSSSGTENTEPDKEDDGYFDVAV